MTKRDEMMTKRDEMMTKRDETMTNRDETMTKPGEPLIKLQNHDTPTLKHRHHDDNNDKPMHAIYKAEPFAPVLTMQLMTQVPPCCLTFFVFVNTKSSILENIHAL